MPYTPSLEKVRAKMDGVFEHLKKELAGLRGGRASLSMLDHIKVDYYGTPTPLKQVSNLAMPDGRMITIQPWDTAIMKESEKASVTSDLGITPAKEGKLIRLPIPHLSEERRKDLVTVSTKYGEDTKINIRGIRREGNEELTKLQQNSTITEDDWRRGENEIQKVTDADTKKVDELLKKKEEEILEI